MNDILNDDVLTSKEIISNLKTFEVLINLNIKIQNFVFLTFQQQKKIIFSLSCTKRLRNVHTIVYIPFLYFLLFNFSCLIFLIFYFLSAANRIPVNPIKTGTTVGTPTHNNNNTSVTTQKGFGSGIGSSQGAALNPFAATSHSATKSKSKWKVVNRFFLFFSYPPFFESPFCTSLIFSPLLILLFS